ncbi:hypothetical protein IS481_02580 [Caldimonas thermodepolymerans]|jgi:Predicted membrane protein|uniref:Methylamine utilization protein MauE n=1 Tax=Caldimonas thermodepolymerans TaxID=215580 RepID=A0A2S5T286_9BURK|nr:hypothetical protein [Caldimonas thermodepolymerans]PPE69090.1 hypothetical protein C1702_13650 [Caldimonas thermodepolymerans]QPC32086.1 hypothetical protein IS481_02580 [Caldimonas thermodepolymerans]RDH95900.1 putative membrane protein [Caldimonas thermodepolymerans]TCP08263.1 putative membrane protein [Caldimonas thermodepolymerans]UZG48624.1 hypothetical protein ONS87_03110 [Caldimonas thermodepolymerans]
MVTPLLMLLILTLPLLAGRLWRRAAPLWSDAEAAAWGLGLLFLFTASGHFLQADAMTRMLPPWVPQRLALVHATGVLEIAIALGLFLRRWRTLSAWAAALVLVAFFPANVYAAFQHAPMGGHAWGPAYLLVRAPLQLVLLGWTWWFLLRGRGLRRTAPA